MKVNASIACLALVLVLVGNAQSLIVQAQTRAAAGTPASATDVDKLFAKIYPVFVHPRCANCHGIVVEPPGDDESVTKESHPAKEKDDPEPGSECGNCHDQTDEIEKAWALAPPHLRWAGRDADFVCAIQAAEVRRRNTRTGGSSADKQGSYLHHLNHDSLINQAWDGLAGGALSIKDGDKQLPAPPNRADFRAAAAAWVEAGAPCRTTALISQAETFSSSYVFPAPGGLDGKVTVNETAKRAVVVRRLPNGRAEADVDMSGSHTMISVVRLGACSATNTITREWSRSSPRTVNAEVKITVEKEAGYAIAIEVAETQTTSRTTVHGVNDCGAPNVNSSDTVDLTWPEWTIEIQCPSMVPDGDVFCLAFEPQKLGAADGLIRRRVVDRAEPTPWLLESPAATNRGDTGAALPVDVTTTWYFVMSK